MHWDGYTVFSVISGVMLIITGLAAGQLSPKDRIYALIGGVFFGGYGIYVAKQTSGIFFFPVWIFIIPVVGIGYLVVAAAGATKPRPGGQTRGTAPAPEGSGAAAVVPCPGAPGPVVPRPVVPAPVSQAASVAPARPAAWSPPPPPPGSARPRHAAPPAAPVPPASVPSAYPAAWSPPPPPPGSARPRHAAPVPPASLPSARPGGWSAPPPLPDPAGPFSPDGGIR
jgi:hypothetical protein